MVWESCKVSGDYIGAPVKVRMTGARYTLIALGILATFCTTFEIACALHDANDLKRQELEIQKQRLDLARRQYTLDSLQYFYSHGAR